MTVSRERVLSKVGVLARTMTYGGMPQAQVREALDAASIFRNDYAKSLLSDSAIFATTSKLDVATVVSVSDLGFSNGATFKDIFTRAIELGLGLCPLQVAPYLRLQYRDQEEQIETGKNRAPKGSVTIMSPIPFPSDESYPKGFYLRKIDGKLRLRGFVCSLDYVWEPDARIVLIG